MKWVLFDKFIALKLAFFIIEPFLFVRLSMKISYYYIPSGKPIAIHFRSISLLWVIKNKFLNVLFDLWY